MKKCFGLMLAAGFLMMPMAHVRAQESSDVTQTETSSSDSGNATQTTSDDTASDTAEDPDKKLLLKKLAKYTNGLEQKDARHFFVLYGNYSIVNSVRIVEKDVTAATEVCKKENPKMKDRIDERFAAWKKAIAGPKAEAEANIKNMSEAQTYMSQAEVNELFDLVDKTSEMAQSKFKKVPVSTPEACEFMLTKMDETQSTMISLLSATMKSLPLALQQSQE